jgi:hypothetical protein
MLHVITYLVENMKMNQKAMIWGVGSEKYSMEAFLTYHTVNLHCAMLCKWFEHISQGFILLKFNLHCEVLRGWMLNLIMVFRDGAFGRWVGFDIVIRVDPPRLNPVGFRKRGRENRRDIHTHLCIPSFSPCGSLCCTGTLLVKGHQEMWIWKLGS